jgi:flagellar basal-body rod protein FlgC
MIDFFSSLDLSASGLSAQRVRLNAVSSNLANANTTRAEGGGPYRRMDPIFATETLPQRFASLLDTALGREMQGVRVVGIARDSRPPRIVHDPKHPDADARGYVSLPNVNMVEEMVNMITASRSYEANLLALQTVKGMAQKTLSILGK